MIYAGMAISMAVIGFNIPGDGLRDILGSANRRPDSRSRVLAQLAMVTQPLVFWSASTPH